LETSIEERYRLVNDAKAVTSDEQRVGVRNHRKTGLRCRNNSSTMVEGERKDN
jgi:hypothetical protein